MNALTKRYIFCACGGTSGAMLALQFNNSWALLVITILMAVVGWVVADAPTAAKALKENAREQFRRLVTRSDGKKFSAKVLARELLDRAEIVFLAGYTFCFVLVQTMPLILICIISMYAIEDKVSTIAEWGLFAVMAVCTILAAVIISVAAGITLGVATSKRWDAKASAWEVATDVNPIRWFPPFASYCKEEGIELLKKLHTDERAVYAVCFALGTLGGFWVGKHFGVPFGSIAGGAISFIIAWLDWKFLSIKLGWRQAV